MNYENIYTTDDSEYIYRTNSTIDITNGLPKFDKNKYNNLIQQKDLGAAADYLEQFAPKNVEKLVKWRSLINKLRTDSQNINGVRGKLEFNKELSDTFEYGLNKDNKEWIRQNSFDEVDENGNVIKERNKWARGMKLAKDQIGAGGILKSFDDITGDYTFDYSKEALLSINQNLGTPGAVIGATAGKYIRQNLNDKQGTNEIEIELNPVKRKLWGLDVLDWVRKDGKYSFDELSNNLNITAEDIRLYNREHGLFSDKNDGVYEKNGKTYIRLTKDHPLFDQLIKYSAENSGNFLTTGINVYGVHKEGNKERLVKADNSIYAYVDGLNKFEEAYKNLNNNPDIINGNFSNLTIYGGFLDENVEDNIKKQQQIQFIGRVASAVLSGKYEVTSNAWNKDKGLDEKASQLTNVDLATHSQDIADFLTQAAADGRISLISGADDGNNYGVYIMTSGAKDKMSDVSLFGYTPDDMSYHTQMFFIKGLLTDEVKAMADNDTKIQALKEYNSMRRYKRGHKFDDGSSIEMKSDGKFYENNNIVSDEEVQRRLIIDYTTNGLLDVLLPAHLNNRGEFTSQQAYDNFKKEVKLYTERAIQEDLYPGIPFIDKNENPMSIDDVWSLMNEAGFPDANLINSLHPMVAKKIEDMFRIYRTIMINGDRFIAQ